jgi:N-acetylglutamate synthase
MVVLMNRVEIRTLDIEDYDLVINLWKTTEGVGLSDADSKDNINMFLQRNPGLSLVAEYGGELVGAILCGHDGRRGYLHHLAVRQDQKLKGIGSELVKKSLKQLRAIGIKKCHIFVFQDNVQGIKFWTKQGWETRQDLHIMSAHTEG